jgi:hypothetical protein
MDATSNDKRLRERAKYLVPNTNNNFKFGTFSEKELKEDQIYTINEQLSTITDGTPYQDDPTNQYNYLEEFFPFRWKKVYTVKQYIGRMQRTPDFTIDLPGGGQKTIFGDEARGFIGIKDIINAAGVNKFPTNRTDLVVIFGHVVGFINGIIQFINGLVTIICGFKIPVGICTSDPKRLVLKCTDWPVQGLTLSLSQSSVCTDNCSGQPFPGSITNTGSQSCPSTPAQQLPQCCVDGGGQPTILCEDINCGCSGGWKILGTCFQLKTKCLFSPLLCKNCSNICDGTLCSCCPGDSQNGTTDCSVNDTICGGAACCGKIKLIPLRCADEGKEDRISLLKSPFSEGCNATYVKPFTCKTCGGLQTKVIKDWASCLLEPVAVFLRMLKFDFYNDWVGGTLYFPLIKRKYKLKKNKRKFGQIKKDKFCDYDCYLNTGDFELNQFGFPTPILQQINQPNPTFSQWRIRIPVQVPLFPVIEVEGCAARVTLKRSSNWYGTEENDDQTYNLNLAVKEFEFVGKNNNNEKCAITFDTYYGPNGLLQTLTNAGINVETPEREVEGVHGKPTYVQVDDNWVNIGGHGHHRNICDETRMMERREYFKSSLDCIGACGNSVIIDDDNVISGLGDDDADYNCECYTTPVPNCNQGDSGIAACKDYNCLPDCGSNGVAPCIEGQDILQDYPLYTDVIKHGLISWEDEEIYYTPIIKGNDRYFNGDEYKGNLMLPTTIQELGSSVYCDIDDIPFIMDSIPPTTFNASYEEQKYLLGEANPTTINGINAMLRPIQKMDDRKNISLNLRAYVEFSCTKVVCENILAPVVQSQVGVEMIDKNDLGIEIGNCFLRFNHDDELRNYFCRRFNGYRAKNQGNSLDLSFHHQRPGSIQFENNYGTYPEIKLVDGFNLFYTLPEIPPPPPILSEYNDGDFFVPGDGCGYNEYDQFGNPLNTYDYFYGVAPGQTSGFINYPNVGSQTIDFGFQAQTGGSDPTPGVDEIFQNTDFFDDFNNGSVAVKGIRFNRSQTPYYLYFGLVPGKTALHKTVGLFFADKIDAVTLEGLGSSSNSVNENINNTPNVTNNVENNFSVYKTCLGETLIEKVKPQ